MTSDPTSAKQPAQAHRPRRTLSLFGAVVIGFALFGYLVGIIDGNSSRPASRPAPTPLPAGGDIPAVAAYRDISQARIGANADWSSHVRDLKYQRPTRFDPVVRTPDRKLAAITDRARNRVFDGAPPVIPHQVDHQSAANCLVCHGEGLKLGNRVATKISHPHFSACTQCHVEAASSGPGRRDDVAENDFSGLFRSGPGTRAMMGAPPTIPHFTFLREDCMSCHGTIARPGLRTTHPWLSNCQQCHVGSADMNNGLAPGPMRTDARKRRSAGSDQLHARRSAVPLPGSNAFHASSERLSLPNP